jgi:hypothetical protein
MPASRVIAFATVTITAAMVVWLVCVHFLARETMQLPLVLRAGLTLIGLLPVGILLGFPFPTAVRQLDKSNPNFIAWAWGVNGVTSVLASIAAIVIAMRFGFTAVVTIAAAMYLVGMLSYRSYAGSQR